MKDNRLYWICRVAGGEVTGPYAGDQVRGMWDRGEMTATTLVCEDGAQEWTPAMRAMGREEPESVEEKEEMDGARFAGLWIGALLLVCLVGMVGYAAVETKRQDAAKSAAAERWSPRPLTANCQACHREVSRQASACPHCGEPKPTAERR